MSNKPLHILNHVNQPSSPTFRRSLQCIESRSLARTDGPRTILLEGERERGLSPYERRGENSRRERSAESATAASSPSAALHFCALRIRFSSFPSPLPFPRMDPTRLPLWPCKVDQEQGLELKAKRDFKVTPHTLARKAKAP